MPALWNASALPAVRYDRAAVWRSRLLGTVLAGIGMSGAGPMLAQAQSAATVSPQASSAASVELPPVVAQGTAERAGGPVAGYVAHRSTAGTKTDTSLLETPQSISVVPRDQITDQNAESLNQALRYTSGVTAETRGGVATRYDQMNIRGFMADDYLDGLKLLNNGWYIAPQIDPYLLERIDVLKGPVSVLYGQSNAGGIVDQISKLPTAIPQHEVGLEFGNFAHVQGTFDLSGPIDQEGHWLYRLTGIGRSEDGQVATTKNQRLAIAPALTWHPDDSTTLTLQALYQHDPASTSYGSIPPSGTVLSNPFGSLPRNFYDGDTNLEKFDRTETSLGYQFSKRFDDGIILRSRARWFHTSQDYASVYGSSLEADNRTLDRGAVASRDTASQVTLDNSVEIPFATGPVHHTVLAGFDYQHLSTNWLYGFGSAPSLDIFAPDYSLPVEQPARTLTKANMNQYGVYLQDQVRWNHWVLTLSGRQDWASTFESNPATDTLSNQWASAFTGRAGLTYVFPNGIAPYVSYSESFNPIIGVGADGSAFKPERGRQYEVGVKYQPPGTRTLLTAAVFDLTRQNLQTPDLENPALSVQSGEARSRGVELEARASLTDQLDVIAAYTYLDTVYTKDNSGLQGKRLPGIPQHEVSGWARYTWPDEATLGGLSLSGGLRYTGSTFNDQNTFKVESFLLADAAVEYELGRKLPAAKGVTLYVNGHNLADSKYVASCYYGNWCAYGYGRQVMGGLRYRW